MFKNRGLQRYSLISRKKTPNHDFVDFSSKRCALENSLLRKFSALVIESRARPQVKASVLFDQAFYKTTQLPFCQTKIFCKRKRKVVFFKMSAVSRIRQNYHEDCEALINKQINMELYASYVYLSMVTNFTFYFMKKSLLIFS